MRPRKQRKMPISRIASKGVCSSESEILVCPRTMCAVSLDMLLHMELQLSVREEVVRRQLVWYRAREKRQMEEGLQRVVTLGAAEAEVDDMAAWVARSRRAEEESKRSAQRATASRVASMYDQEVTPSSAPQISEASVISERTPLRSSVMLAMLYSYSLTPRSFSSHIVEPVCGIPQDVHFYLQTSKHKLTSRWWRLQDELDSDEEQALANADLIGMKVRPPSSSQAGPRLLVFWPQHTVAVGG